MYESMALNLAALAALVPAALLPLRRDGGRDALFWGLLLLAVTGPSLWVAAQLADSWNASLSADLWVGIAASLVLFAGLSAVSRQAWRLTPLLVPYLLLLGVLASLFHSPERFLSDGAPSAWVDLHILVSVITLGFLTLAAVAALASFLQSRALKLKRPNELTRMLPSVADSERLSERLLALSEVVLGLGVISGMATQYLETGNLLKFGHKILFTLLAFAVIGLLLTGRRVCGVRGQIAARVVLLAYLLLIIGYFGVKFVHQVLLA
jgi:ABC-type uncharacterized transport system permease subunit